MLLNLLLLVIGLGILIVGAEILVKGASSIAKNLGVSPLVIGLTVVAFGTSAPEMVVNIMAALNGTADIALGNIIGSNIANILLVLGLSAMIYPIKVHNSTVHKEIPFSLLAIIVLFIFGNDILFEGVDINIVSRGEGFVLISFFAIFLYYTFGISKEKSKEGQEDLATYKKSTSILLIIGGLLLLIGGGELLVREAVIIATQMGVSETLIGLTIVAIGTSFPELATAVVAALHHNDDIAVGGIVGSNIFNIFWILGLTSIISPLPFNARIDIDLWVAVLATVILFLTFFVGKKHELERRQGFLLFLLYLAYLYYLVQRG
ncbi:MAG: calcium/sodium antiporter [Candidatus Pacebacteria bacterium]|nr:calcium/sodium antiporter [Candidatus Paceibacterota bacterium]